MSEHKITFQILIKMQFKTLSENQLKVTKGFILHIVDKQLLIYDTLHNVQQCLCLLLLLLHHEQCLLTLLLLLLQHYL